MRATSLTYSAKTLHVVLIWLWVLAMTVIWEKAKAILNETVAADDTLFLKDPEPKVAVSELADSSVNFIVRPWVGVGRISADKLNWELYWGS